MRQEWDYGKEGPFDSDTCPHDVATLLKDFLRDLPDPLLCRDLYHAFVQTQSKEIAIRIYFLNVSIVLNH